MTTNRFADIARDLLDVVDPVNLDPRYVIRDDGGGQKWFSGLSNSGRPVVVNHASTRRQARVAMNESVHARAMVERFADTISDGGLRLEMAPIVKLLGITPEQGAAWARDVETRFHLWASDRKQHRSEQFNFYQSQTLYQIFQQRDNDIFARLYYDNDPALQNPLQFDFVDPDQIRGDAYFVSGMIPGVSDGIERDDRGREKTYKIWVRNNDNTLREVNIPATDPVSGRRMMLHGFKPEYAGQGRGYSRLAHAIQEFENITDFSVSTIKRAINQTQIVGFVEPSKDEDAAPIFGDILTNQGAGPAAEMFGSNPTSVPDGEVVPVIPKTPVESYMLPEATIATPGSIWVNNLTKGSTIKFPNPTSPADSYDKFVDAFSGAIAASLNIPLEVVLMKFSNNYSASRGTLLLFWRVCCNWRAEMDSDYLSPIVEMWLSGEIGAGRVVAPGWSDPRLRAAWLNKNWIGSSAPDIDPVKSATARRLNCEIGASNLERDARELNGSSAADNIAINNKLYATLQPAPWVNVGGSPDMQSDKPED